MVRQHVADRLTIRKATFSDAPRMVEIMRWGYGMSALYRGRGSIDEVETNRIMCQAIQRHGGKGEGGTWAQVAERDGRVEGFIIGLKQRVYQCAVELGVCDLWWIGTPACPAKDKIALMKSLIGWAKASPKVIEVASYPSDVLGNAAQAERILLKLGFKRSGSHFLLALDGETK